jgi:glycosyltransferase involved in cell wall biosynthesis
MQLPISVIIPTYNRSYCLRKAIDSVYNQTVTVQEIIVIDDGSTDDTRTLIKKNYPNVIYIHQTNQGVSASRNKGIKQATAPWIAFLDSDDSWHKKKLEYQYAAVVNDNTILCHTDEIWIRNGKQINQQLKHKKSGGNIFMRSLELCLISPSSVLINKNYLIEIGSFDTRLPACEDYDLWLRITSQLPVSYIDIKLTYKYGGHPDQLSKKHWGMDRFRIQAISKLLFNQKLDTEQYEAAINTLTRKVTILMQGAAKRDQNHTQELHTWLTSINIDKLITLRGIGASFT